MVTELFKPGEQVLETMSPQSVELLHAAVGISGEAGELLDLMKKMIFQNREVELDNVLNELGDIEFYLEAFRQNLEIIREHTLQANMNKLSKRYQGKYSDEAAQARADEA